MQTTIQKINSSLDFNVRLQILTQLLIINQPLKLPNVFHFLWWLNCFSDAAVLKNVHAREHKQPSWKFLHATVKYTFVQIIYLKPITQLSIKNKSEIDSTANLKDFNTNEYA